ncbi:hypothetical protein HNQ93_000156 [Hymenobacter luteus]|uniref:MORN repeat variant n=2 Tax=Hymenobacter TaxID=89966 RepID=A0A7W9SX42_9BACT|nr:MULTISPECIES: hypothetical protein [Hymenobacter]MBB4600364.1 hypothetical protein [Hymenobacter latericoloratus]MBB6057326.1 hypothetical protein [Hymenobacter luteus]
MVQGDSIILFYDAAYVLTPPACASIRRHTRLTATGDFRGEVRDYWMDSNTLILRAHYQDAKATGTVEQFFTDGRPAVRGQLRQGVPADEWHYWYPTGQRHQTLVFSSEGHVQIQAYWDSTGAPRTTDGAGYWEGTLAPQYVRIGPVQPPLADDGLYFRGTLRNGVPHGEWQSVNRNTKQVFTSETFVDGRFRGGKLNFKPASGSATLTAPQIRLQVEGPQALAERFQLGYSCAEKLRQQQEREKAQARGQLLSQLVLPKNQLSIPEYQNQLAQKLRIYSNQPWFKQLPDRTQVYCRLDSLGQVTAMSTENVPLKVTLEAAIRQLPHWEPATIKGRYVSSGIMLLITAPANMVVEVRPAAVIGRNPTTGKDEYIFWHRFQLPAALR